MRLRQAVADEAVPEPETAEQRIVQAFADADTPLSQRQIRERAATRPATVAAALQTLIREDRVERAPEGGYVWSERAAKPDCQPPAPTASSDRS